MAMAPHPYQSLIAARASAGACDWLSKALHSLNERNLPALHAGLGRRLGSESIRLSPAERSALAGAGLRAPEGWPASQLGRVLMQITLCDRMPADDHVPLVARLLQRGDSAERAAALQGLCSLPDPQRFLALAVDACRSHVADVFEAIACENPYPARYFSDAQFNQMVLKAFFTEVKVARILGLGERRTPTLRRMAEDYANERRAAGRSVPADLHLATTNPQPGHET